MRREHSENRIEEALRGQLSPDELDEGEQQSYLDRFAQLLWQPSASEQAFFRDRRRRGVGVGLNDAGEFVVQEPER